jgi:hypothetical protein
MQAVVDMDVLQLQVVPLVNFTCYSHTVLFTAISVLILY